MNIGDNIKKYRKLARITQVQLAEKIQKSESTVRKYEANNVKPDFAVLNDIADALGCTLMDLLDENKKSSNINFIEITQFGYLKEYVKTLGYEVIADESDGYLVIKTNESEYEITQFQLDDLLNSSKSFMQFKLQDIINNSRKIGK